MSSPLGKVARSSTAPLRNFFNNHFEMVKAEVRRVGAETQVPPPVIEHDDSLAWQRVSELENVLAETSLFHARQLNRMSDDITALSDRVRELEGLLSQLVAVHVALGDGASEPSVR